MNKFFAREGRFSGRVLRNYIASGLPATFGFRAAADGVTDILLYDEIGYWGITGKDFAMALAQIGSAPINLRINSPGGDITEGYAIYNALINHPAPVTVTVDGIAASAASFIAMAGMPLRMAETSMMMIHKGWGITVGNDDDHLETAVILGKMDGQMADLYARKSGMDRAKVLDIMKAETWFTAAECLTAKLCDAVISAAVPSAKAGLVPVPYSGQGGAPSARITPVARGSRPKAMELPPYDPDGDGDNDAEQAIGLITSALVLLNNATAALAGTGDDDAGTDPEPDPEEMALPVVPGTPPASSPDPYAIAAKQRRERLAQALLKV